jgi:3-polyprenyl-4-hydroxybenzoate decarboxylase
MICMVQVTSSKSSRTFFAKMVSPLLKATFKIKLVMQATTWIDRISDESNSWLNAIKSDDQRQYDSAIVWYMKDAEACMASGKRLKAGLSCSCAADCLARLGLFTYARTLYREAASLYLKTPPSEHVSVREMLWSLSEGHHLLLMAYERRWAEEVRKEYEVIARRVDPFVEGTALGIPEEGRAPRLEADTIAPEEAEEMPSVKAVNRFLKARQTGRYSPVPIPSTKRPVTVRQREKFDEKSIINQLG